MSKAELREHAKSLLALMTPSGRQVADASICDRLTHLPQLLAVRAIAAYWPIAAEPDIRPFLQAQHAKGIALYLPRWRPSSQTYEMVIASTATTRGPHGALEPDAAAPSPTPEQLNNALWLIPGLAFDMSGNRLGRGGGFYDRLLAHVNAPLVGIAYHNQLLENIPAQLHDIRMHALVTNSATTTCMHPKKDYTPWNILSDSPVSSSALSAASSSKKQRQQTS